MDIPRAGRSTLMFVTDPRDAAFGTVVATGPEVVAGASLRVTVVADPTDGDLPPVAGQCDVAAGLVRFVPHFPFAPGVRYRAVLDGGPKPVMLDFALPPAPAVAPAEVTRVYPSADRLPENLLRFYVCFSAPMQRGRAGDAVAVLDADGRPVSDVLYSPPVELWDRTMTCLTVLLDPGRLKRGVGPNRALGPPLAAGRSYRLAIGGGMVDAAGRPLLRALAKRFDAAAAVRDPVAIGQWSADPPPAGTRRPLAVTFDRPLDRAMLAHAVTVVSPAGDEVDGQAVIDRGEARWRFTPSTPWPPGSYGLRVRWWLEDVCGNTPYAPFDRPLRPAGRAAERQVDPVITVRI